MKRIRFWILRNAVCRFKGHAPGQMIPFFEPWFGGWSIGSLHCDRCHAFMQEVRYVKGYKG